MSEDEDKPIFEEHGEGETLHTERKHKSKLEFEEDKDSESWGEDEEFSEDREDSEDELLFDDIL
jgi:hypothetical protein